MLTKIGVFLIETLFGFFVFLTLLRFLLQAFRAPFRNPIGQFCIALTDWIVKPLRRVVPPFRQYDLASLVAAWLLELAKFAFLYLLATRTLPIDLVLLWSVLGLISDFLKLLMLIVFVHVILSWVSTYNPLTEVLNRLTAPLYRVFRFIKPVGQFDLSPLFVLLAIMILLIVINDLGPPRPFGI
jgi:YggT family protein